MNIAVKITKRNFTKQALKKRERKMEQIKNRPHTENVDSPEKVRLNPEFDKIIKEIIDDCRAIRQILGEAEKAAATDAGFFLGGETAIKGKL